MRNGYRLRGALVAHIMIVSAAGCATSAGAVETVTASDTAVDPRMDARFQVCGVNALYVYLRLNKIDRRFADVVKATRATANGSSMLDLKDAAARLGLPSEVRQCSSSDLLSQTPPLIARCSATTSSPSGHYVVITSYTTDARKLTYIDSVTSLENVRQLAVFAKKWTGYVLVPRRQPISP